MHEDNEIRSDSKDLESAYCRTMAQNEILERSLSIHIKLIQSILIGNSIDDLTVCLAKLMNCTVVLEDSHLANRSTCFEEDTGLKELMAPYLSLVTSPSFGKSSVFHFHQKQPFITTDQYSDLVIYRLVSPILAGCELLGFLSLLRTALPFSELEIILMEHASRVFAMQLLEARKIAEMEILLKGNFIEDLILGNFSDPSSIIYRARGQGYDITLPHRVVVVEIKNLTQFANSQDEKRILHFKLELANAVQSHLNLLGNGRVINKNDDLIMLVQQDKPDSPVSITIQLAEEIIEKISHQIKVKLYIGVGSSCTNLADFHKSFHDAKKALQMRKFLNKKDQVLSLEQFKTHALFLSTMNPAELYTFATNQIGSLLAYDETHQTELLSTMSEFIYLRGNVEATAKRINMSVSGLKYRLERIEEVTGHDLKDHRVCFDLQLAIIALDLFGEDKEDK